MHLLFVCTGNTCRSPMAAAMARAKIAELNLPWTVSSAGLGAAEGLPMSALSAQALTRRHIPLPKHRSTMIRQDIVESADVILCMTNSHTRELKRQYPKLALKIHSLGAYLPHSDDSHRHARSRHGGVRDIADPFGGSDEAYEQAAQDIEAALENLFQELMQAPAADERHSARADAKHADAKQADPQQVDPQHEDHPGSQHHQHPDKTSNTGDEDNQASSGEGGTTS
ncbi:low molecular weight protein arginine phosphatase [Alicyclobacillus mengziensis]|uniref:Low molecular weight protein arginine phosphatase n=1 Tax=Alicyclobacillus mengziensis TaxID=2931921 RepID=A0A9X7VZD9_9BACL|nr:low molecular weight protein arginine phosphatase [Alicyclobacillus mengziensis]QSO47605.1 low molecular weight protein arginine phosphatase [Alicyclobacillus mengziensis]